METATRMADEGDVEGGRELLRSTRQKISATASAQTTLSRNLVVEFDSLAEQYASSTQYRAVGSKMSKMHARSHAVQRAVHTNSLAYSGGAVYRSKMKAAWSKAMRGEASDSDCDSD